MARSLLLAAIVLFTLTLGASRSASQEEGFQSINCGGEAYEDPNTHLIWEADPFIESNNEIIHGKVGQVNSSLKNISSVMTTLRFFPNYLRNRKFCYPLGVSKGRTYLLRASFLYGNYDGINKPPTFVLILNNDEWTNVTTSSTTPTIHELIFVSNETDLNICVALNPNSNQTPFISTLELRRLDSTMYTEKDAPNAIFLGHGLMLWRRINYGARTKAEIRYPEDKFDRIWEANTTGPSVSTSIDKVGTFYRVADEERPPAEVMATAITSNDSKGNLSFTYEGLAVADGLRIEMHFQEVDETARGQTTTPRLFNLAVSHTPTMQITNILTSFEGPYAYYVDGNREPFPSPLQFTFFPSATSPRPPLLNALELFRWTPNPLFTILTFSGDVNAIQSIQSYFNLTGYGQGDPCMPKRYTWTWIDCSDDIQPRIVKIDLSNFNLKGTIPPSINDLASLKIVDLSNNMLSGEIPDVNLLKKLEYLDLRNNALTGKLPLSLLSLPQLAKLDVSNNNLCGSPLSFQPSTDYTHIGNTRLCDGSQCNCNSSLSNGTRKYIIAICCLGALYILSMLLLFAIYKARHSRAKAAKTLANNKKGVDDFKGLTFMSKMFTYDDIKSATMNFTTILGEGGFGKVYHGLLSTGEEIAVKTLVDSSKQGLKEFYNEVAILSRVRHKNLVSLIGYCVENTYMLIYEYVEKGNLRNLIYGDVESPDKPLSWTTRLRIALDASQGLEYLHMGCDPTIIHRDVKSSNILLSDKMQAKVADFGLSRLKEGDNTISHVSTANVVGTAGYLDPAYNSTNQLTDKSDVYSFGIVLFELICGRAPIDMFKNPPHVVDWALGEIVQGKVGDIVDPTLSKGYKVESMWKVIDVAIQCVESDRGKRPQMSQVFQLLQNALELEMDPKLPSDSQDVSASSFTSDGKLPTLQYLENIRIHLEAR